MSGDGGDPRGDTKTYSLKLAQLFDPSIYLRGACRLWVEDRFGIVQDYDHLLRGEEGLQGCQIFRVLDPCPDGLGESIEEVSERCSESVATNESSVRSESFLDPVVVEDGQGDG